MALQRPLDQGVHHSRARALELSKLAHDIAGDRDLHLRTHLGRQLGNSALMSGIGVGVEEADGDALDARCRHVLQDRPRAGFIQRRSEEHPSELQSLMRISYAVFCLKKKKHQQYTYDHMHMSTNLRYNLYST